MSKQEFLAELRKALSGLPQGDVEDRLTFYSEMIDDRMEEGLAEGDAVSEIGTVDEVAAQIVGEIPLTKLVKERVRPKRALRVWEIVLLALGSPLWLSLLAALLSVTFAGYLVVWSVIFCLWAMEAALMGFAFYGAVAAVIHVVQGNGFIGLAALGAGTFCAGLSIFLFFGCKEATKGILLLTKKVALGVKSLFIRKEDVK